MTLVFFGTGSFGLPSLDALMKAGLAPLAVITSPDRPAGRDLKPAPSAIKARALEHSLRVVEFHGAGDEACYEAVRKLSPDILLVISFGHLLKKRYLELPSLAPLNVHASLLPRWRGASPMQSALLAGDAQSGVCVMRMVEALDAGDILASRPLALSPAETIFTLESKLAVLGADALVEALRLLEKGQARWVPQEERKATVCSKIKKDDGRVDWSRDAQALDRQVRAFLRWPGSFTTFGGKRLILKRCAVDAAAGGEPGRVLRADEKGIAVATSRGALILEELQQEARKPLNAADFLRGFPVKPGDIFV